jgi:hypothetical protein
MIPRSKPIGWPAGARATGRGVAGSAGEDGCRGSPPEGQGDEGGGAGNASVDAGSQYHWFLPMQRA